MQLNCRVSKLVWPGSEKRSARKGSVPPRPSLTIRSRIPSRRPGGSPGNTGARIGGERKPTSGRDSFRLKVQQHFRQYESISTASLSPAGKIHLHGLYSQTCPGPAPGFNVIVYVSLFAGVTRTTIPLPGLKLSWSGWHYWDDQGAYQYFIIVDGQRGPVLEGGDGALVVPRRRPAAWSSEFSLPCRIISAAIGLILQSFFMTRISFSTVRHGATALRSKWQCHRPGFGPLAERIPVSLISAKKPSSHKSL
jgi:hypothetical protein